MLAAVLALLASFSWGTSDFLAGLESRRSTAWTAALGGQAIAALSLTALIVVVGPARPALNALAAPAIGGAAGVLISRKGRGASTATARSVDRTGTSWPWPPPPPSASSWSLWTAAASPTRCGR